MSKAPSQQMQCMEVWGGSQLTSMGMEFGGLDAWVYSKPHGESQRGGDIYYASSCGTGRITRLLLADVCGHGHAVAATAADLRRLMRQFVNRLNQTEFVSLMNQQFAEMSAGGSFATAVVTTFFSPSRRLAVCNAGHPRPLLYRAAQRHWSLLTHEDRDRSKLTNTPIGMIAIAEYEQFDVELEPGDCLICYTDALIESNDTDGRMLGETGLLKIARLLTDPDSGLRDEPQKLAEKLLAAIDARYPENLTDDDVTVLVVRANGRTIRYSTVEKLRAVGRFCKVFVRAFTPGAERPPLPDWNLANIGGAVIPALGRRWRAKAPQARVNAPQV